MFKFTCSIFAIFLFSFLCLKTTPAQCTCVKDNIGALEEFSDAAVVFTGEIIDIQKSDPDKNGRYYETAKIAAEHAWKENIDSIVTVQYYVYGCVKGWAIGDKYLVYGYANKDKSMYTIHCCCTRTGKLETRRADISQFFNSGYSRSFVNFPRTEKIISAGWMNRRAVHFEDPKYPTVIKKPRPEARVEVRIITDTGGNVLSAEVSRGPVAFHDAALDAAKKLKFSPMLLSGVPTKVSGWVSYDFKP